MTYAVRIVRSNGEFVALRPQWQRLLGEAPDANPFMSHDWLEAWWSAYQPHASLCIVLAERDGLVHGIAPMMLARDSGLGRVLRRMRFIGDGSFETDHMSFLVGPHDRERVLDALLGAIAALPWDIAHFSQMPQDSAHTQQLLAFAVSQRWLVASSETPCPHRTLPRSGEELMRSLPSRLRTAIRSARRNLDARYVVEFGLCGSRDELPAMLESLFRNHASRWEGKGERGVFVSDKKRQFYSLLSSRWIADGSLRFYYLKLDGAVVAQQYCFEFRDTVYLLQEGFDFDYADLNVGNVLRAMVFEELISRGVRHYDFLAGTSRHKRSWSDSEPVDLSIRACRPTIRGRAVHSLPRLKAIARRFVRRSEAGANA